MGCYGVFEKERNSEGQEGTPRSQGIETTTLPINLVQWWINWWRNWSIPNRCWERNRNYGVGENTEIDVNA